MTGRQQHRITGRREFFDAHSLDSRDRLPVTPREMAFFLAELHHEQRSEGAGYVEVRISPRRLVVNGHGLHETLTSCHAAVRDLSGPRLRLVLLVNRDSPGSYVEDLTRCVQDGLPSTFVGVDLAGDERRFPSVDRFTALFSAARSAGLGSTVHAGEFGGAEHIWQAVDLLGAMRIGHGVSAPTDAGLMSRLAADRIPIEVSLTSNAYLGAVDRDARHPVHDFLAAGVPFCLNTDVPLHTGATLGDEIKAAMSELQLGEDEVLSIQNRATTYVFGDDSRSGPD